jgi:PAS domain S-box-containing protein
MPEEPKHPDRTKNMAEDICHESYWQAIFHAIGNPTLILDPHYVILYANHAAVKASGLSEEELQGKKCYQVFHATNSQGATHGCPMAKLLASGDAESEYVEMEAVGGTYMVSCTPVFDDNKKT